ncbi:MAG TPA: polymer-forming cytoskeletal protein [Candidatus Binataceae bacterium]|nr:polymer-forming cytoskeletal protein [Candidatus Binataceae bacterium]
MAPLFQRRSLLIRDDEPDYSVRATHSHGGHDAGMNLARPPIHIYSPPPQPVQPSMSPPPSTPSRLRTGLEGLTGHARGLTRHLADAGRVRIATIAGRLAKTFSEANPRLAAFAAATPSAEEAREPIAHEERRWREYEASQPADLPDPTAPERDAASELLRMRAERILTESERIEVQPYSEDESAARDSAGETASAAEMSLRGAERGKYGMLMDQVGDRTPQNWDTTPEEPPMHEEHTNGTHMETRARSVTLDGDGNTIDITHESRFSGHLKFSGTLIVEGEVEGELEATRIDIREGGTASARILGDSITIAGKVNGDVIAHRSLEMTSTGRLQGDVTAPEMKLQPGAVFKGRCSIGELA